MYGGDMGGFGGGFGGGFDAGGQFGGADQFGGGGFGGGMGTAFSQQNAGGFQVDNSTPDGKAKGNRDKQSLIPTTIKQLKNAPGASAGEASFTVDGHDLYQITIVGLITTADEQSTNLQYQIDDGTGSIMVKMWIDADASDTFNERRAQWKYAAHPMSHAVSRGLGRIPQMHDMPVRREGTIVRVIGQLRAFNNTRSIVAYSIQPITDFNEYTFHFIDVVHTHLKHTKGKPPSNMMGGAAMGYGDVGMAAPTGYAAPAGYGAPAAPTADVNNLVLSFFKTKGEHSDTGCRIQDVCAAVAGQGITEGRVREAVDFLSNEGHLYSTIDDDHYKATS